MAAREVFGTRAARSARASGNAAYGNRSSRDTRAASSPGGQRARDAAGVASSAGSAVRSSNGSAGSSRRGGARAKSEPPRRGASSSRGRGGGASDGGGGGERAFFGTAAHHVDFDDSARRYAPSVNSMASMNADVGSGTSARGAASVRSGTGSAGRASGGGAAVDGGGLTWWLPALCGRSASAVRTSRSRLPNLGGLKFICMMCVLGSATTLLFGRGVVAIAQGVVGILFGLEGYYGARKFNRSAVALFLAFLLANIVASVAIGLMTLNNLHSSCETDRSPAACQATFRMYGMIMLTGSPGVSICFAFAVAFYYRRMPRRMDRQDLELDEW